GVHVAKQAVLPTAETMPRHRHGDGDIDPHHAHLDAPREFACHAAVACVTGDAVGELVSVDQAYRLAEVLDPYAAQYRSEDLLLVYPHVGPDVVEEGTAEEEAVLVPRHFQRPAIGQQLCSFAHADIDVARDTLECLASHDRAHLYIGVHAVSDAQGLGPLHEHGNDPVRDITDQHGDADGHATLAGRAEGRPDEAVDRLLEAGIRHHDQVILRAAECLYPLAELRGARVEAPCDRRRSDEAQGLDFRMLEQRIDGDFVTLHDVENAIGQLGLLEQLGHYEGRGRIALTGLEHEGVPGCDGDRKHPTGNHAREVEGRDARDHTEGLAQCPVVDP